MLRTRLLVLTLIVGLVALLAQMAVKSPKNVHEAPDIAFNAAQPGLPKKLSDWKGKVVILDLWATWCGPCKMSIPEVAKLYTKYHAKGLEVVGIAVDDASSRAQVPAVAKEMGINYPIAYGEDIPGLKDNYPSDSIPAVFVIDREGKLAFQQAGYDPAGTFTDKIDDIMQQ